MGLPLTKFPAYMLVCSQSLCSENSLICPILLSCSRHFNHTSWVQYYRWILCPQPVWWGICNNYYSRRRLRWNGSLRVSVAWLIASSANTGRGYHSLPPEQCWATRALGVHMETVHGFNSRQPNGRHIRKRPGSVICWGPAFHGEQRVPGFSNSRNGFSPSSGGWMSQAKLPAGLVPSESKRVIFFHVPALAAGRYKCLWFSTWLCTRASVMWISRCSYLPSNC